MRQHATSQSGDMSSLAWGGANRTPASHGGTLHTPPRAARREHDRPRAYRGLGGPHERALGPPVAFNPRVFYPPGLRSTLSHTGSSSSGRTASLFSSLAPSRSVSQQQITRESRSASRLGSLVNSRVCSRRGSRQGSRSGSRTGRHTDEDDGHDLTSYNHVSDTVEDSSKSRVAIVSHGRRNSDGMEEDAMYDNKKGIKVTTTWDVDVESPRSEEATYDEIDEMENDRRSHGTPACLDVDENGGRELH